MENHMGNRAVVSVEGSTVGVYLHWNGGAESVTAFLKAAKDLGVRSPTDDTSYFYARFVQIVGNFFGGTTSVGVGAIAELDTNNGDNGHFIIGADFAIIGHKYVPKREAGKTYAMNDGIYAAVMEANQAIFKRES
jgi:hypothetical protein